MTVYVDPLMDRGWILRGEAVRSCHLFTDQVDLEELHRVARRIGCRPAWFQRHHRVPHYDLTGMRRQAAIAAGAVEVSAREAVELWNTRTEAAATRERAAAAYRCPECTCDGHCARIQACVRQS